MHHSKKAYKTAIEHTYEQLNKGERVLSNFSHYRPISIVIQTLNTTLLRPIPTLFGLSISLVSGICMTFIALLFGYPVVSLSSLGLIYILGFIIGIIYEYMSLLWKTK